MGEVGELPDQAMPIGTFSYSRRIDVIYEARGMGRRGLILLDLRDCYCYMYGDCL